MTLASSLGERLWGTPLYDYGQTLYQSAIEQYLRVNPEYRIAVCGATATFRPTSFLEYNSLHHRIWEEEAVLRHLLTEIRADDVFFDVGATLGIYSCLANSLLSGGTVVPFEPYPPNVGSLTANLEANEIDTEVRTRPLSDGRRVDTFSVYDTTGAGAQHGSLDEEYPDGDALRTLRLETVAGDELVERNLVPRPTIVKIDVQGEEPRVLDGLSDSLTDDRCRAVYVEAHDTHDVVRKKLREWGFDTESVGVDRPEKEPTIIATADTSPLG